MKKNIRTILGILLAICCLCSLAACSGGDETSTTSSGTSLSESSASQEATEPSAADSSVAEAEEPSSSAGESSEAASDTAMFASIGGYINSEEVKSQLDAMSTDELGVTVSADGNRLIYTFAFPEGTDTSGLAESLDAALETQASTFEMIASSLQEFVAVTDPIVVVTYTDSQGNVITSQEFTAP